MSKNHDRYKEDYLQKDADELLEIETEKFEKFRPKKKQANKAKQKGPKKEDE